ncbi:MAG: T9SS type A sorting domain-containing protein, partial [Ignavibacteriales bacterium]|nr:T9SS type A sorting domain-containing protein [Ignavibacteriales bacterium]
TSFVPGVETATDDKVAIPQHYALEQNYPNPFNPSTVIRFSIAEACDVHLEIFNSLGQSVMLLINQQMIAGNYEKHFEALNLCSGIYLYRLKAGNTILTKKMLLLK